MASACSSSVVRIDNIGLAVRDVVAEAAFFREQLGLEVAVSMDAEPPSASVQIGDQYLYVFQTASPDLVVERAPDLVCNRPGIDHVSFTVDDIELAYVELRKRGVEFDGEPSTVEEWGIRLAPFRDPEANSFFLVQRL